MKILKFKHMNRIIGLSLIAAMTIGFTPQLTFADYTQTAEKVDILEEKLPQLAGLFDRCDELGISTDYERVNYTVIKDFIVYAREDMEIGEANLADTSTAARGEVLLERAEYVADYIDALYDETAQKLQSYIDSQETPLSVNRYFTTDARADINGESVYGKTKNNQSGEISQRPLILTGYGHFAYVVKDIEKLKDLGVSLIQFELGPEKVIVDPKYSFAGNFRGQVIGNTVEVSAQLSDGGRNGKALHVNKTSESVAGQFYQLTQSINVKPETRYTVSFYAKGKPIRVLPNGWNSERVKTDATDEWKKYTLEYTMPENKTPMDLMLVFQEMGESWIDDITVIENGTGENVILNGDFETPLKIQNGFGIDTLRVELVKDILERAEKSDIGACLLLSPHYFPKFIVAENPDELSHNQEYTEHTYWNINHTRNQEVIDAYLDELIPKIKDYKSLHSICLSNEPTYNTLTDGDRYLSAFQSYLKKQHKTIENLNAQYGSEYGDFDDIPMPSYFDETALYYDWTHFNNTNFADWHKNVADRISNMAPAIPLHSKMLQYMPYRGTTETEHYQGHLMIGSDARKFSEFSDYAGTDAHAYYDNGIASKMLWYDYLLTTTGKPVINTEDHVIWYSNTDYSDAQAKHVTADLWQGAVHGRAAQVSWVYGRSEASSEQANSLLTRPDVIAGIGKTSLDLARLSDEVTALATMKPTVALMYSHETRIYNHNHYSALLESYKAASELGRRCAVMDDIKIAEGGLDGIELLILPEITHITPEALKKIAEFAANGGKIVSINEKTADFLSNNQYALENDAETISKILEKTYTFAGSYTDRKLTSPTVEQMKSVLVPLVENSVVITDADTNQDVSGVEWRYTKQGRKTLINLYNTTDTDKNVTITENGLAPLMISDLRENKLLDTVVLTSKTPVLLGVLPDGEQHSISDIEISRQDNKISVKGTVAENRRIELLLIKKGKEDADSVLAINEGYSDGNGNFSFLYDIDLMRVDSNEQEFTLYLRSVEDSEPVKVDVSYSEIKSEKYKVRNFCFINNNSTKVTVTGEIKNLSAAESLNCMCIVAEYNNNHLHKVNVVPLELSAQEKKTFETGFEADNVQMHEIRAFMFEKESFMPAVNDIRFEQ